MKPARVLSADPPWKFGDPLPGKTRGAARRYPCLPLHEIMRFPLPVLAADSWLFLWYVTSMVDEARAVVRAWGFAPTGGELVWVKTGSAAGLVLDPLGDADPHLVATPPEVGFPDGRTFAPARLAFGMGRTVRNCDERCLIARRGRPTPASRSVRSVFFAPVGEHSAKPDRFYDLVEELTGAGPRVELFARRARPGWTTYGNELRARGAIRSDPMRAARWTSRLVGLLVEERDELIAEKIGDKVSAWHLSPGDVPLHAWLGMTHEEYAAWVELPRVAPLVAALASQRVEIDSMRDVVETCIATENAAVAELHRREADVAMLREGGIDLAVRLGDASLAAKHAQQEAVHERHQRDQLLEQLRCWARDLAADARYLDGEATDGSGSAGLACDRTSERLTEIVGEMEAVAASPGDVVDWRARAFRAEAQLARLVPRPSGSPPPTPVAPRSPNLSPLQLIQAAAAECLEAQMAEGKAAESCVVNALDVHRWACEAMASTRPPANMANSDSTSPDGSNFLELIDELNTTLAREGVVLRMSDFVDRDDDAAEKETAALGDNPTSRRKQERLTVPLGDGPTLRESYPANGDGSDPAETVAAGSGPDKPPPRDPEAA